MNLREFVDSAIEGLPITMRERARKVAEKHFAKKNPMTPELFRELFNTAAKQVNEEWRKRDALRVQGRKDSK